MACLPIFKYGERMGGTKIHGVWSYTSRTQIIVTLKSTKSDSIKKQSDENIAKMNETARKITITGYIQGKLCMVICDRMMMKSKLKQIKK